MRCFYNSHRSCQFISDKDKDPGFMALTFAPVCLNCILARETDELKKTMLFLKYASNEELVKKYKDLT